jgi:hypothetical protein
LIAEIWSSMPPAERRDWPPILSLGNSVVVTLTYLRRNRVQCELAETYGVSQSTISRAISAATPLLARALARYIPVAEDSVVGRQYIVDGSLLPVLAVGRSSGSVLGQAQDHRREPAGRMHPRR